MRVQSGRSAARPTRRLVLSGLMRLASAIALIMLTTVFATGYAASLTQSRNVKEATAVLRIITADDVPHSRCEFGVDWDHFAVPDWLAQKYLRSKIGEPKKYSFEAISVSAAVDPGHLTPTSFCSEQDFSAYSNEVSDTDSPLTISSIAFPVFDEKYETAIVVVTNRWEGGHLRLPGSSHRVRRSSELSIIAFICKKLGNEWKLIDTETLGVT